MFVRKHRKEVTGAKELDAVNRSVVIGAKRGSLGFKPEAAAALDCSRFSLANHRSL
jgi:hypothetical protein